MSYIVLKFDDLTVENLSYFASLHEYCKSLDIPVCYGVIGKSLDDPSKEYVAALRKMIEEGVELWNHGYRHTETEFSSNQTLLQEDSIKATQNLLKEYFGRPGATFGSPHNNSTEETVSVLSESFPEITNYFYMVDGSGVSSARQLLMRCNYEITTGVVDLDFFRKEYDRIKDYPYFVMQGHPSFWRAEDFDRFKEMLSFLIADGNEFVTTEELGNKDIGGYTNSSVDSWMGSLENFFVTHDKVFFYGAGEIGRELYRFMSLRGFKPYGFVVSDGKRIIPDTCGVSVFEFSEIKNEVGEIGIVPTILGRTHKQILGSNDLSLFDIWMPSSVSMTLDVDNASKINYSDTLEYDRFIDYVRYDLSLLSWKNNLEVGK
ncbi:MAG: DUF2334 domain-containing protein [Butyrivibrio sp.]|nr:DUF2334 domain-containing protein [Butyrivibrio sp.]